MCRLFGDALIDHGSISRRLASLASLFLTTVKSPIIITFHLPGNVSPIRGLIIETSRLPADVSPPR
ncbi:hypothetical protein AMTR_s00235p00020840 [Amborella trichopoda]|uniref:Uncharacterized protein n=1 Tax=Amborella trichopoda TaxID=13333 RepID=W1NUU3_AMBTC|nr:hypothetical protein AMTR_s00235p00020840 [Amborella trichopoda]